MASDSDLDTPVHWSNNTPPNKNTTHSTSSIQYPYSPSTASIASSSSDSAFSIDAPSSQSSEASSDAWSSSSNRSSWIENSYVSDHFYAQQPEEVVITAYNPYSTHQVQQNAEVVAHGARRHPRRTQRLSSCRSQDGQTTAPCPKPPPSLVRQSERKDNFVDSLVDTTTQMIETIWPLSVANCTRDATPCGKQQNLIGLRTFVQEVLRRSKTSYSTLQVALYYLILVQSCIPKHDFTMEQSEDSSACRAMQCGRRMFLAALILASKYLQDRNYSMRAWSKISGLRTCEINTNELAFLSAVNWKLHIPEPVFHRWTDIVLKYSPSAQVNASPGAFSVPPHTWKTIVPILTPELDTVPFGTGEISDDSGYNSPGSELSDMSPPPIPIREELSPPSASNEPITTNLYDMPRTLKSSSRDTKADEYILPTLPHLRPLPTPQLTPQTGTFCTPAVSASGPYSGRSMGHAMAEVKKSCLSRSTMDNPHQWKPNAPAVFPTTSRRSSSARSVSSASSPESVISNVTSRPTRSFSISSVASSNCAPPLPTLAVQATRRCANMQLHGMKEEDQNQKFTNEEAFQAYVAHARSMNGMYPTPQQHDVVPYDSHQLDVQHSEDTREAAVALRDLHLDRKLPPLEPQAIPRPQKGRKRVRPNSMDFSVQSCVREEIAPRCLSDVTNTKYFNTSRGKDSRVLPDPKVADSYLVSKCGNSRPSSSSSNTKPALSGECLPNKRTCAGSDRGKRGEARLIMQNLKIQGPGMWEGILD